MDVSDHLDEAVASLLCHRTYIDNLGDPSFDPDSFLRNSSGNAGAMLGTRYGVTFELIPV